MSGKNKIRLLSDEVISKIAAGEVVENAASAIKELIENAVDAASSRISVKSAQGQMRFSVADNGEGMSPEDLPLSIERHATSKIMADEDLFSLMTMGFRGEALYAIAAVSKMVITSRERGSAVGAKMEVEGGKRLRLMEAYPEEGTTVEVNSLFFNTPARLQFQKNESAGRSDLRRVLNHAALCYLETGFSFEEEGEQKFSFRASLSLIERAKLLLGEGFTQNLEEIESTEGEFSLKGYVSRTESRPNRKGQYLFINRRPVFSSLISSFVQEAFLYRLEENRFPLFLFHLSVPPSFVDANVHPQKREVRLREEERLKAFILSALLKHLDKRTVAFQTVPEPSYSITERPSFSREYPERRIVMMPKELVIVKEEEKEAPELPLNFSAKFLFPMNELLLFQEEGELVLVHSQRAEERILFEEMKRERTALQEPLLFPFTVEVDDERRVEENLPLLKRAGIVLTHFGKKSYLVESAPASMAQKEKILELLDELRADEGEEREKRVACALSRFSKNRFQTKEAAEELMKRLYRTSAPEISPRGKPIVMRFSEEKLLKGF